MGGDQRGEAAVRARCRCSAPITPSAVCVIEIAGRLVGEQDARARWRARGRWRRAAARRPRAAPGDARRAAQARRDRSSSAALPRASAARDAGDHLRQHDVLERREFRQQMMELIDEAELPSGAARCAARRTCAPQSRPPISTSPPSGRSSSPATCSSVDLPAPDGPTSATISPGRSASVDAAQHRQLDAAPGGRCARRRAARAPRRRRSLIAQRLDRIEPRRAPGRVERRQERQRRAP